MNEGQIIGDSAHRSDLRRKLVAEVEELRKLHGQDYDGEDIRERLDSIASIDEYNDSLRYMQG